MSFYPSSQVTNGKLSRRLAPAYQPVTRQASPQPWASEDLHPSKRRKLSPEELSEIEENVVKFISPYVASRIVPYNQLEHVDLDGMKWPSDMTAQHRMPPPQTPRLSVVDGPSRSPIFQMMPIPDSQESASTVRTVEQDLEPLPITWDLDEYFDPAASYSATQVKPFGEPDKTLVIEDHPGYEAEAQAQKTTFDRYLKYDGRDVQAPVPEPAHSSNTDPSFRSFFLAPELDFDEALLNFPPLWPSEIIALHKKEQDDLHKFLASEVFDDTARARWLQADMARLRGALMPRLETPDANGDSSASDSPADDNGLGPMARSINPPVRFTRGRHTRDPASEEQKGYWGWRV